MPAPARASAGDAFSLPPLPYDESALSPALSARTVSLHYNKHHRGYVDKLNELVAGTPLAELSLEDVIKQTADDPRAVAQYHNAAQAWNHTFYWHSLSPKMEEPSAALRAKIDQDFGGLKKLSEALEKSADSHFASGWSWLVLQNGKLAIMDTRDADTPLAQNIPCLLALDVWEHAYYMDYQNLRPKYVSALVSGHLSWKSASTRFEQATS
jgi:Fe-Mn family superoxide dismutase